MIRATLFLASFVLIGTAFAKTASAKTEANAGCADCLAQAPKIHVMPMSPEMEEVVVKGLEGDQYQIHRADEPNGEDVIDARERDHLFLRAKILALVADYDHVDRDLLYIRVKDKSVADVAKQYPKIPKEKLAALKKLIRERQ